MRAWLGRAGRLLCLALLLAVWRPGGAAAQTAFPPQGQLPELAQLLDREGTYVAPRVRQQVPIAAEEQLQDLITRADQRGVTLRIAVLEQAPGGYADLGAFADALMAEMRLSDGLLVVATPQTLAARADRLPAEQVAPFVTAGQSALQSQGIVAGVTATVDSALDRLAALVTPLPRPPPEAVTANAPSRAAGPQGAPAPLWPVFVGIGVLLAGLALYWWTTMRRWREVLRALEGAQAVAERLANAGDVSPATVQTAQQRLAIGERALAALRALPWWHVWVWPWAPPPQLALAERAFSESLRLLGGPGAVTLAPAGATAADAALAAGPLAPAPPDAPPPPAAGNTARPAAPAPPAPLAPAAAAPGALAKDATLRDAQSLPAVAPPAAESAPATAPASPPAASAAASPVTSVAPGIPSPARAAAPPPAAPTRTHWWQRGRPAAEAEPAASLAPEHVLAGLTPQEPIACFFCGRPLAPEQAEVGAVALGGFPLRPLACHRDAALLAAGERPGVRARSVNGQAAPWFQDATYQPAWDFDPRDDAPTVAWDALPAPDRLFAPPPRVVVHAGDPRWARLGGQGTANSP
ncbi:MAG TPA: hypothetical protein VFE37_00275 [Chloroflexota bacterium]|nr:hypothetical protein [Chloroflexota bacterium]